jgi:NAD(P)-dependent dehydrogenase (short-subunit alcohol dehydrogenase family)
MQVEHSNPRFARAIVTGGSGGIGGAIIGRLIHDGAAVANIDAMPTDKLPTERTIIADISNPKAIDDAFDAIATLFGGQAPDLFVACAAISRSAPLLDVTVEDFDRIFAINVRGTFLTAQAAARRMRSAGGGSIVMISSVAAEQAWALESVYSASKAATRALTQSFAMELAPFNIRVNAIGPGPIDHQANAMASTRSDPDVYRHEIERTPMRRFGRPDEVADAVMLLASAPWTTGQTLYVDGGFMATGLAYLGAARDALLAKSPSGVTKESDIP